VLVLLLRPLDADRRAAVASPEVTHSLSLPGIVGDDVEVAKRPTSAVTAVDEIAPSLERSCGEGRREAA
jgi:hypothetical protein